MAAPLLEGRYQPDKVSTSAATNSASTKSSSRSAAWRFQRPHGTLVAYRAFGIGYRTNSNKTKAAGMARASTSRHGTNQ